MLAVGLDSVLDRCFGYGSGVVGITYSRSEDMESCIVDEMKCVSHPGLHPHSETNGSICEFFKAIFQLNRKLQKSP